MQNEPSTEVVFGFFVAQKKEACGEHSVATLKNFAHLFKGRGDLGQRPKSPQVFSKKV
jgi:hypothetical protein